MKVPQIQAHGWDVYAEKNASAVKSEPAAAYTARRVFFRAARSAMMPRIGLESATKAGGYGYSQPPQRAACEGQTQEGAALAYSLLEEEDEVDGNDRGHAACRKGGVGPVVHTPGADDPALA